MLKNNPQDFQPTSHELHGIYRGVVEDNNDPEKMGRCKIRVFGVHTKEKTQTGISGVPTDHLPWSEPCIGLFGGGVSGYGGFSIPEQGSHVFLFFENGHILNPRFFASAPGYPTDKNHGFSSSDGFSDPDNKYPNKLNEPDWNRLARNEKINDTIVGDKKSSLDTGVSSVNGSWDEPEPGYSAQYPNNNVFQTSSGLTIEIDNTSGNERIHLYHPSNSYLEIDSSGNLILRNDKDRYDIVLGESFNHIKGNEKKTVDGNQEQKIKGKCEKSFDSDKIQTVGGNSEEEVTGEKTIKASKIYLN